MSIASNFPSSLPSLLLDFANVKRLDPRITFTRTTTATYYDGVTTAKAEENMLTYSQAFDNAAWSKFSMTVTANAAAAPDGTTTAELLYPTSTGASRNIYQSAMTSGVQYTISVYAKASGLNFLCIYDESASGVGRVWFNLSTGAVGTVSAGYTASISNAGSGWYRCVVVRTVSGAFVQVGGTDADNSTTSTTSGTNGILLWGAQLEQRSSATAYTATTTQAITNYIPVLQTASSGQARFDHNPTTGESLGLLIEEARTNSLTYSAQFDNAAWTKSNVTITANTIVAPDGTLTGDKAVESTTASVAHYIAQNSITVSSGAVVTLSVFAKSGERTRFGLIEPYVNKGSFFDLSNGTVVGNFVGAPTSSSITPVGNGWYRCSITATASGTTSGFELYTVSTGTTYQYTGDGFSGLFFWGAQLEAGSFATSYIPTVASSVTRNADAASMTGTNFSSWFSPSAGTMYVDANVFGLGAPSNESYFLGADNASSSDRFNFHMRSSTINTQIGTTGSGYPGAIISGSYVGVSVKVASAYATGNFGASVNSGTVATNTSALQPWSPPNIGIGYAVNSSNGFLNGRIKKIAYYPIRVTNAQLQALTV